MKNGNFLPLRIASPLFSLRKCLIDNLLVFDEDAEIGRFSVDGQILFVVALSEFDDFKLGGMEFVQKGNRNAHYAFIVHGNVFCFVHINPIIIVIIRIAAFVAVVFLGERDVFVSVP